MEFKLRKYIASFSPEGECRFLSKYNTLVQVILQMMKVGGGGSSPGGGGGALRYGLAIMCRTTLGSGGGGRDSKGEIGGR